MAVERITIRNIQEERPIMVEDGPFIPIHLSVDHSGGLYPGDELVPAADYDRLLSACKQWKQATEARLRPTDSRGEAAKSMLKPDADLVAVIQSCSSSGQGEG